MRGKGHRVATEDEANGAVAAPPATRVFMSPPDVGTAERDAILAAFDSGWIAPVGPELSGFEADLAAVSGRPHVVALASCTAALRLILQEVGIGPGDTVVTSTLTFIGSVSGIVNLGATPVFVDCDASWNASPELLLEAVDRYGAKAVVVVDLYGRCADYPAFEAALAERGVALVEDAAEAVGASVDGRSAGSFGVASAFSFNGNKLITTSGGGACLTNDERLAKRVLHLATQAREPAPYYHHVEVGSNERLSNLLAALGRAQLRTLDDRRARRAAIRERYKAGLDDLPGIGWNPDDDDRFLVNHWLTCLTIDPATGRTPEDLRLALEAVNIESRPTWKPMHLQPVFDGADAVIDGTSERVFESGLCLPSGGTLTVADQERVIEVLRDNWPR
jgi:pyridoxal phosphate-dependent aminotransferase EpsN